MKAVEALLEEDRVRLCGPRWGRQPGARCCVGGTVRGQPVLGGRRVAVRRPRVRRVPGGELELPTCACMRREDPLTERAVEQMLVGVSTRKYARSLEPLPEDVEERGTSKSTVSRRFVAKTRAGLEAWQTRPLHDLDLVALVLDGIEFGEYTLVVAMGIDSTGTKHPLAIREGSTENVTLCRSLLADPVARGVPADRAMLVVIDGGKGLRSAARSGSARSNPARATLHREHVLDGAARLGSGDAHALGHDGATLGAVRHHRGAAQVPPPDGQGHLPRLRRAPQARPGTRAQARGGVAAPPRSRPSGIPRSERRYHRRNPVFRGHSTRLDRADAPAAGCRPGCTARGTSRSWPPRGIHSSGQPRRLEINMRRDVAPMTGEILRIKEVTALLRPAEKMVDSMAQRGGPRAFKIRGQWAIRRADLDAWAIEQRGPTPWKKG